MLDAPDPDFRDVLAAVEAWRPDAACLAAGDECARRALRCWAGALSDQQIVDRILGLVRVDTSIDTHNIGHYDAAIAVARHCAIAGMTFAEIIEVMVHLAVEVRCWPDDPDAIAYLVRNAIAECTA